MNNICHTLQCTNQSIDVFVYTGQNEEKMGIIASFSGIKIKIKEREHNPPHIHAEYNEHEEVIEIRTFATSSGWLPNAQRRAVLKYMKQNQQLLLDQWVLFTKKDICKQ